MKSLDWTSILGQHPVFSALSHQEVDELLDDEVSEEKDCPPNHVILKEGELGDSIFLIGSGEVWIVLRDEEGHNIPLSTLRKGEFFGELAVVEQKPRTATVIAKERCLLLEIKGQEFLNLMRGHPAIEFKVLLKVCERLRHMSEDILSVKLKDVDERFRRFNTKLDAELKVIDASLKAVQTVFDQTNTRANEVIESADRSRTRLTTAVSAIGGVVGVVIAIFGAFGIKQVLDIKAASGLVQEAQQEVTELTERAERQIKEAEGKIEEAEGKIKEAQQEITELIAAKSKLTAFSDGFAQALLPSFRTELLNNPAKAGKIYKAILEVEDQNLTDEVFKIINGHIPVFVFEEQKTQVILRDKPVQANRKIDEIIEILNESIKNNKQEENELKARQTILSYYSVLWALILDRQSSEYGRTFKGFKDYARKYKGESVKGTLDEEFEPAALEPYMNILKPDKKTYAKTKIAEVWKLLP